MSFHHLSNKSFFIPPYYISFRHPPAFFHLHGKRQNGPCANRKFLLFAVSAFSHWAFESKDNKKNRQAVGIK
ncbi:hypothetical protein HMPREF6485_0095 [Segatella buccae ATCC 33574]|uniref:Uncharacterized protein n=1 Tax=Segatella buccae ATCC 33574 TaxID=873513 RepID=E6K3B0_9BACT|nr:hypothetical protein HMPREF6485_0095 [Segatella buccae ATCC 33574]